MIQSKWKKLLYMQKAERIGLIMEQIVQGYTMAEAARVLGMHRSNCIVSAKKMI